MIGPGKLKAVGDRLHDSTGPDSFDGERHIQTVALCDIDGRKSSFNDNVFGRCRDDTQYDTQTGDQKRI